MTKQSEILKIEGMTCGHCIKAVQQALASVDGVEVESVEIGTAQVSYDPSATDHTHLVEAIEEEGYTVIA